ncbi:hypothetical protein SOVF_120300 [Spinacia oleracea]|nr:hypothetical protein SOVF_120300 [Spinacia oleracea]
MSSRYHYCLVLNLSIGFSCRASDAEYGIANEVTTKGDVYSFWHSFARNLYRKEAY